MTAPWNQIRSDWQLPELLREANPYTIEVARPQLIAVIEAAKTVNDDLFFDPVLDAALADLKRAVST